MKKYRYEGPVWRFDRIIEKTWVAVTYANSKKKALSNLAYRYKRNKGLGPEAYIKLSEERIFEWT